MSKSKNYLLKIKSLKKEWYDKDEVLLHAAFQILVDFVEEEKPHKHIDWNFDKFHLQAWKEIKNLYEWWKKKRPLRQSPLDDRKLNIPPIEFAKINNSNLSKVVEPNRKKYSAYYRALKEHAQLEQKWYDEDQKNLHRLIKIRRFLWT